VPSLSVKRGRLLPNYLEDTEWNYLNEPPFRTRLQPQLPAEKKSIEEEMTQKRGPSTECWEGERVGTITTFECPQAGDSEGEVYKALSICLIMKYLENKNKSTYLLFQIFDFCRDSQKHSDQ
jgi:hypothetical protein